MRFSWSTSARAIPRRSSWARPLRLHHRDIDTVHWSPNPGDVGLVYVHQMGHVGGYYDQAVPDTLGIPRAGGDIGHAWTEGHFEHYFLTGDPVAGNRHGRGRLLHRPRALAPLRLDQRPRARLASDHAGLGPGGDQRPVLSERRRIVMDRVLEDAGHPAARAARVPEAAGPHAPVGRLDPHDGARPLPLRTSPPRQRRIHGHHPAGRHDLLPRRDPGAGRQGSDHPGRPVPGRRVLLGPRPTGSATRAVRRCVTAPEYRPCTPKASRGPTAGPATSGSSTR
jgi:hypothetical protein